MPKSSLMLEALDEKDSLAEDERDPVRLVGANGDRAVLERNRRETATRERVRGAVAIGHADEERGNHGLRARWQCRALEPLAELLARAQRDRRGSGLDEQPLGDTARLG